MPLTARDLSVAICGAGIGGIAAAVALRQIGCRVTVYERANAFAEIGAGLQIGPNGVAVLDALGLGGPLRAAATRPERIRIADHKTAKTLMTVPLGLAADRRWKRPYLHLHRADLLSILQQKAKTQGVEFRLGCAVSQRYGNRLVFSDGAEVTADLIVAADGARSTLRSQAWPEQKSHFTGQIAWRALIRADRLGDWSMPAETLLTLGPGKHVVLYRLRQGALINLVAVEDRAEWTEESWSRRGDPDALRARFSGWNTTISHVLEGVEETFQWGLFELPVLERWGDEPLVLLGDAAHPMLPFLAQGAVMALEDAWGLRDAVSQAETISQALATYQIRRHARATRVQKEAARQARLYHLKGPLRPCVHLGMRTLSHIAPDFGARRFDWLYGADVTKEAPPG